MTGRLLRCRAGDVGRELAPKFDGRVVHREFEIIKNDLPCNSVRICGLDLDRLVAAGEVALA